MILKKRICISDAVILLVLTYILYKEKRIYELYLTMNIRQDIVDMKNTINTNDRILTKY